MKIKLKTYCNIAIILIFLMGCSKVIKEENRNVLKESKKGELTQVVEVNNISNINGFKIENESFIFSGTENNQWGYFALDLHNYKIHSRYNDIGLYDSYIALNNEDLVFIDLDSGLYVKENGVDKKIDEEVYGSHGPNLLVSPDKKSILYTKGEETKASLYIYTIGHDKSKKIKENISKDAFLTFSYTTQWSNNSNYFIFHNNEIFSREGEIYTNINGTAVKWSPNDKFIGFIRKPKDIKDKKVSASHWETYIGNEFVLLNIDKKKETTIYTNDKGLIDVIDSIQWSEDSNLVGISIGDINKSVNGELEKIDYESIFIYNTKENISKEIINMPYNFYEIILNNYVYGSSIGKRDRVEIVEVFNNDRKVFDKPVILNSKDMFVIKNKNKAYLANGPELVKLDLKGGETTIMEFPWEINEVYFDSSTEQFIIINKDSLMFVLKI